MIMTNNLESTAVLLSKVKNGDIIARDLLCSIYLPILTKWAHGRLPHYARDLSETDDLVQVSLLKALDKLDTFTPMREGSFLAYLRKILLNNIRSEIRRYTRNPNRANAQTNIDTIDESATALESAVGVEIIEKYETALANISEQSREAVILRVEFGFTYPEVATAMNCNSANAARMIVTRALQSLAEQMNEK